MLFSELYKIIVKKVTILVVRGEIAPIDPPGSIRYCFARCRLAVEQCDWIAVLRVIFVFLSLISFFLFSDHAVASNKVKLTENKLRVM